MVSSEVLVQRFKYVRVFNDDAGESHFDDLEATMELTDFAPPAPPLNLAPLGQAEAVALVGGDADWGDEVRHPSPVRQLMCVLVGRAEITTSDGESRQFGPGDAALVEDTAGKGHSSRFLDDGFVAVTIRLTG
jgi:hypothetical protein